MEKLKPLIPTLREKKRYVSFEIISKESNIFAFPEVQKAVKDSYKSLYGETGEGKAGIILLSNKYQNNKGIIRINNKCVEKLKLSLALIKEINKKEVIIQSLITSGMIRKAEEKINVINAK